MNKQLFLIYVKDNPGEPLPPEVTPDDLIYDLITTPQISIYHYEPKQEVSTNETLIPIYLTDWYQREYYYDDDSLIFKLRVEVDGNVKYIDNVKAGDYNVSLGVLGVGKHCFNIEVIDEERNLKSQRIFHEILIVDDTYEITESETYRVTASDLATYNITLDLDETASSDEMHNNVLGMNDLLNSAKSNGYRKLILPENSYIRINKTEADENSSCIFIPSDFTLDLNNGTIKLDKYDDRFFGDRGTIYNYMIKFVECNDSHVINGTLEGNYFERKLPITIDGETFKDSLGGSNGEHDSCIFVYGGEHNTVENVNISKISGYIIGCEKKPNVNNLQGIVMCEQWGDYAGTWKDDIILVDGVETPYTNDVDEKRRCTSAYIDLTKVLDFDYVCIGKWLSEFPSGRYYEVDVNFYDENKNFIEYFKVEQSREFKIPSNAKYLRATVIGLKDVAVASAFYLAPQYQSRYNKFSNINFIDNRTCVAPNRFLHLTIDNFKFIRSGQSITPLAIDAEDGGNTMQDLFIRNCAVEEVADGQTGDYISVAGSNIVFENNTNMSFGIRAEVHHATIRNNTLRNGSNSELSLGWRTRHTVRVYDNDFNFTRPNISLHAKDISQLKIKKCKNIMSYNGWANEKPSVIYNECDNVQLGFSSIYKNCNFYLDGGFSENDGTSNCKLTNCNIGCKVDNGGTFELYSNNYGYNYDNIGTFTDCIFNVGNSTLFIYPNKDGAYVKGLFENCTFECKLRLKLLYDNEMGDIQFNDCIFNEQVTLEITNTKVQFNNCTFNNGIVYKNEAQTNTEFNNCTVI